MRGFENETKIIQYQQGYLQAYFSDGTSLAWIDDSITYYSLKGNKINLSIQSIHHSPDVSQKLTTIIKHQNRFNDEYIDIPKEMGNVCLQLKYKKYKIKEFTWSQSLIKTTNQGYQVISDDNNAKCYLSYDLYRVYVQYLQLTNNRQISKEQLFLGSKNQRKFLLQKYSYKYNEFPTTSSANQIQNQYHLILKQFTIFNLPSRWIPPMKLIWGYLLSNEIITHPFCYIDLTDPDNRELDSIQQSKMPTCKVLKDFKQGKGIDSHAYPIYGKPNHSYKFKWMYISQEKLNIIAHACQGNNIFCEKEGFWFIQGLKAIYNSKNKAKIDYEVNINVFPITIRFEKQSDRQIKSHILAFSNYLQHRQTLDRKLKSKPSKRLIDSQEDIICEEVVEGIGIFKAFRNHMARATFIDRIIVTFRQNQINVIDSMGKCWIVGNDPILNNSFGWHISQISNFYQKIFDNEAFNERMRLNQLLQQRKSVSNVFLKVTQHIKQKGY